MKTIVVKWQKETAFGYGKAMRVVISDHERFTPGSRFDFGFFSLATDEGYTIVSIPIMEGNCRLCGEVQSRQRSNCVKCKCPLPVEENNYDN